MPIIGLPLLFLVAGLLGIIYYRTIPTQVELRQRLPNKGSVAGILLTIIIGFGIWAIIRYADSRFMKISGVTTLLFYLLTFESLLLLCFRWLRSNTLSVLAAAGGTFIPFLIQYFQPSYALSNALIIAATLGATALIIRLDVVRTRIILIMAGLFTINDVLNVTFVIPKLPLTAPHDKPLPLLIFPTVNIGGHVVGSGDFMFLALTTLLLVKVFSARVAGWYVVAQSVALAITLAIILHRDVILPYLVIMTPIFGLTYYLAHRQQAEMQRTQS